MRILQFRINGQKLSKDGDFSGLIAGTKGYKPVVYTDMPTEVTEGKHWESGWEEKETEIKQVWKLVDGPVYPTPEPTPEERISSLETTTDELKSASNDTILMMADIIGG